MPLSANSVIFLEMMILAESGITFFEHEKKCVRISTVFRHCVRAFLLFSSTFCVHFYYFPAPCVPALSACISTALQRSLHACLLFPSTFLRAHFYCVQHCRRAFLLRCSTLCMHFCCVCMCLYVCVCMRLYVLYCMCLYVFV